MLKKYDRKISESIEKMKIMSKLLNELKENRENNVALVEDQRELLILEQDVNPDDIPLEPLVSSTNSELALIAENISKEIKEKIVVSQESPALSQSNSMEIGDVSNTHIKIERKNEVTFIQNYKRERTSTHIPRSMPQKRSSSSWSLKSNEVGSQVPVIKSNRAESLRAAAKNISTSNKSGVWAPFGSTHFVNQIDNKTKHPVGHRGFSK